jgi:hypothetical protein
MLQILCCSSFDKPGMNTESREDLARVTPCESKRRRQRCTVIRRDNKGNDAIPPGPSQNILHRSFKGRIIEMAMGIDEDVFPRVLYHGTNVSSLNRQVQEGDSRPYFIMALA